MTEDEKLEEMRRRLHQTRREDDDQLDGFIRASLTDGELDRDREVMRQLAKEARNAERADENRQSGWTVFGLFRERIRWAVLVPAFVIIAFASWAVVHQFSKPEQPPVIVIKTNTAPVINQPPAIPRPPDQIMAIPKDGNSGALAETEEFWPSGTKWTPEPMTTVRTPVRRDSITFNDGAMNSRQDNRLNLPMRETSTLRLPVSMPLRLPRKADGSPMVASAIAQVQLGVEAAFNLALIHYKRDPSAMATPEQTERIFAEGSQVTRLVVANAARLLAASPLPTNSTDFQLSLQVAVVQDTSHFEAGNAKWSLTAQVEFLGWKELATGTTGRFKASTTNRLSTLVNLEFFRAEVPPGEARPKQ